MFHCDAGWNSDLGVSNIQKIIEGLHLDLVTEVVNWEEMKDLQRAFFQSQVPFVDTAGADHPKAAPHALPDAQHSRYAH